VPARSYPPVLFTDEVDRREASRAVGLGRLLRLAPGVYSGEVNSSTEDIVRRHLWQIVAHEMPGAVIADRSARDGGVATDGALYVVSPRTRPLELPGVTVLPRRGAPAQPGDMKLPDDLYMSGEARALLDNLAVTRRDSSGRSRTLPRAEVETWVDHLCAARGESALNRMRDQARQLAPVLGRERELAALDAIVGAALTTRTDARIVSPARAVGQPADQQRLATFSRLAQFLDSHAPDLLPALPQDDTRRALLPFYEAYFSNFIEGTEFTLDEAAAIVFDHEMPQQRPQDAHDVLGTYGITADEDEMRERPSTGPDLLDLLKARHAVIMGARPETLPGRFKERANQAGSSVFVTPDLVEGTLLGGFEVGAGLISPFARAVYLMFLVSEVHPFADGNGRVARLVMNSELVAAGEVRIVIPTVYRLNYLAALKAATHTGNDAALLATLAFARRWTARVDFSDRRTAEADLARTSALRDAREAEDAGIRLQLP
jgi:Fic/DOC family